MLKTMKFLTYWQRYKKIPYFLNITIITNGPEAEVPQRNPCAILKGSCCFNLDK